MKPFFVATLFSLFSNFLWGQTNVYHPFLKDGAQWSILNQYFDEFQPEDGDSSKAIYKYFSVGDTIIEDKEYLHIEYAGLPSESYFNLLDDTIAKKVYVRLADTDTLLYDFSAVVGQNISNTYAFLHYPDAFVESIDSIQIGGNYRKRFNIRYTNLFYNYDTGEYRDSLVTTYLIEGIGSQYGPVLIFLLNNGYSLNDKYELICYLENGEQLYSLISEFANCDSTYINYSVQILTELNNLQAPEIFPNLVNDFLTIKFNGLICNQILLFDLAGKLILEEKPMLNNTIVIDVSKFPKGTYIVKTIFNDISFNNKVMIF